MTEALAGGRRLILASTSPFRRELLARLALPFTAQAPETDETHQPGESAPALVAVSASIYQSIADKLQADNMDQPRVCEINRCRQIAGSRLQTVGAFVDHLLLAFHALGLAAVWMAGPTQAKTAVENIINIGDNEDFVALIPVGYADEQPVAPLRKPVEQIVTILR